MNIQEAAQLRGQLEAALTLIRALAAQVDRMEERLLELEIRRGPGRPPKQEAAHAS